MRFALVALVLVVILFATGVIGCRFVVTEASAGAAPAVWDRPFAEHRLVVKGVAGVKPIIDARCTGSGSPSVTAAGVRRYHAFACKVLTNVGGRYPWVAVGVTVTGPTSFRARTS